MCDSSEITHSINTQMPGRRGGAAERVHLQMKVLINFAEYHMSDPVILIFPSHQDVARRASKATALKSAPAGMLMSAAFTAAG